MNIPKFIFIMLTLVTSGNGMAQFSDNFNDGDFTINPAWSGDVSKFIISSGRLKLQALAIAETAYLSTPSQAMHAASWEFYVQLDFNPSSSNYTKVYLTSDQPNIAGPLNGYFIRIGGTTRDISLYRQNGTVETRIIDGTDETLNTIQVRTKVKVTRSESGEWKLFTDIGSIGAYITEGSFTDNVHTTSGYTGIVCIYTSTRSDKFWFDDFVVTGIPVPDTTPPAILSVIVPSAIQIVLQFSETLEIQSAESGSNFLLNGIGNAAATTLSPDKRAVTLIFSQPMANGVIYSLRISNIRDPAGNVMPVANVDCRYFKATEGRHKDIIITELFPDPSPQIKLPAAEFIEIYNRSNSPFDIGGWKLTDGSSSGVFPSQIVLPGEYWIVTASSSVNAFRGYGKTIGLTNFPTLNNDADTFVLKDSGSKTIDSVSYTTDWYRDEDKKEGGWTLELIDVNNPCGEEDNWIASEDERGGTPASQNSVNANKPDLTPPDIVSVFAENEKEVLIIFNEKLDASSLKASDYNFQPAVPFGKVRFADNSMRSVMIMMEEKLQLHQLYKVEVKGITDCNLNTSGLLFADFALPEETDSLDVVINEILFNPRTGGVDFVEVFNNSDKFFNLKNWKIANYENGSSKNELVLFTTNTLLRPFSFLVFTTNPSLLKSHYPYNGETNLLKTVLPSMNDDSGSVSIIDDLGKIIDAVNYSKSWHSVFLKSDDGVSLERISVSAESNNPVNWTSASSTSGYASPGLKNSQTRRQMEAEENDVFVVPDVFSPLSGPETFVQIYYKFSTGQQTSIRIYDAQGQMLKTIASNASVSTEGSFRWDGDRDDGTKARFGYYFIWVEAYDGSGQVRTFRKRVIVNSN